MERIDLDKVIEDFEKMTKDAEKVQRETLKKILEENESVEYLQNLGLNGRTDPESFKACVPLVTHKELEPYLRRIADGETSVLTRKPITTMSQSSGTTQGMSKFFPFNDELMEKFIQIINTTFAFMNREYPIGNGKTLQFIYYSKPFETKGGLLVSPVTANFYSNPKYKSWMKAFQPPCCSPDEVICCPDFNQSLYCHLLCGLIFRDEVQFVFSTFAHSIVIAFRSFGQLWKELCTDIRNGILSSRVTGSSIRAAMSKLLKPNPELADLIYTKCSGLSNWYGVIPQLFPNAKFVHGIMTGTMESYVEKLRHYAGNLPLLSYEYGASEGWVGGNVNPTLPPELVTFTVFPNVGYYEFSPLRKNADDQEPKPVGLTEVKVGQEYEVILTTFAGLYRYKLGDVVKVMGFHNSTPEVKFIRRSNVMLNISIDRNTENDLQLSVEAAAKILLAKENLNVVDYTSHVDLLTEPGHYVILWEISGEGSEEVLKECCNCLDRSFIDLGYASSRKTNAIGPLELRILRRGTFQKILDHYLGSGGIPSQFKTPRCIAHANKKLLQILSENVDKSYFSTAF